MPVDARALLRPLVALSDWRWLQAAASLAGLLAVLSYVFLAPRTPGVALLASSALAFVAVLGGILAVWPVEEKITLERQLEVTGTRLLLIVVVWFGLGFALLWGLNQISPEGIRVPVAWDAPFLRPWENSFFRRVTFWPFYVLVLLGCRGGLPTPPGAC